MGCDLPGQMMAESGAANAGCATAPICESLYGLGHARLQNLLVGAEPRKNIP